MYSVLKMLHNSACGSRKGVFHAFESISTLIRRSTAIQVPSTFNPISYKRYSKQVLLHRNSLTPYFKLLSKEKLHFKSVSSDFYCEWIRNKKRRCFFQWNEKKITSNTLKYIFGTKPAVSCHLSFCHFLSATRVVVVAPGLFSTQYLSPVTCHSHSSCHKTYFACFLSPWNEII